jgi:hypothetical protein
VEVLWLLNRLAPDFKAIDDSKFRADHSPAEVPRQAELTARIAQMQAQDLHPQPDTDTDARSFKGCDEPLTPEQVYCLPMRIHRRKNRMDTHRGYLASALLVTLITTGGCPVTDNKRSGFIVTEEQMRSMESLPDEEETERGEPQPGTPQVLIAVPQIGSEVTIPVPVSIRFVAKPDAQIVPDSLRVRYGPFDVTAKVREHLEVSQDGIGGQIEEAHPGKYKFRVAISDTQNRTGEADLKFRVVAGK